MWKEKDYIGQITEMNIIKKNENTEQKRKWNKIRVKVNLHLSYFYTIEFFIEFVQCFCDNEKK